MINRSGNGQRGPPYVLSIPLAGDERHMYGSIDIKCKTRTRNAVSVAALQERLGYLGLRSTAGAILNEKGFSTGIVQLTKGTVYNVSEQTIADVILLDDGKRIRIAKSDVAVSEGSTESTSDDGGGFFRVISAKYGRPNERQYDVKEEIKKRIPKGELTTQVEILVSDKLLRAKAGYMVQTGYIDGYNVVMKKDTPCVLTITYELNGQRFTKEGIEGSTIKLP